MQMNSGSDFERVSINHCHVMDDLHEQVERFWLTDSFGSQPLFNKPYSIDDLKAREHLESTLRQTSEGNYEVGMLWSNKHIKLQNNRPLAERRFQSLSRKFEKNPGLCEKYMNVMNGYVQSGYARKMSPEEINQFSDKTYYLPHHGVVNPKKPEKLRVVFDAAATYKGESLNSHLLTGPDLINSLIGVLMRLRCGSVAISADIESMFHRIFVKPEDSDALRFLWKFDMMSRGPPDEYKMLVHIFGAKSSPCCANYSLLRCADDNEYSGNFSAEALYTLRRSFFVDDMLRSLDSVSEAIEIAQEMIRLTKTGGFKLTKWASNSKEVLKAISDLEPELGVSTVIDLDLDKSVVARTLGMKCDMGSDEFVFESVEDKLSQVTKRSILSQASSVFDPLGLIAPFVLRAKLLLQLLWEKQLTWDEIITDDDCLRVWFQWCSELRDLKYLRLPQCYWPVGFKPVKFSLYTFADASEKAFAAVLYLQMTSEDDQMHVSLVASKSRVALIKRHCLTLPRLELQAAILAVRLHQTVKSELDLSISGSYFWSDSLIVLQYISNEGKRLKTFVANRVAEIRRHTEPSQWFFVPGTINPADDCTRGLSVSELLTESRWFRGPEFLWFSDQSDWPSQKLTDPLCGDDAEVKCTIATSETVTSVGDETEVIIDPNCFSSLSRLQHVTAWCF